MNTGTTFRKAPDKRFFIVPFLRNIFYEVVIVKKYGYLDTTPYNNLIINNLTVSKRLDTFGYIETDFGYNHSLDTFLPL